VNTQVVKKGDRLLVICIQTKSVRRFNCISYADQPTAIFITKHPDPRASGEGTGKGHARFIRAATLLHASFGTVK